MLFMKIKAGANVEQTPADQKERGIPASVQKGKIVRESSIRSVFL